MAQFIVLILIVALMSFMADAFYKKSRVASILLMGGVILILSLFAANRDYKMGIDLLGYGLPMYEEDSRGVSISGVIKNYGTIEFLYHFVNYLVYKIFNNFRVFLFLHQIFYFING